MAKKSGEIVQIISPDWRALKVTVVGATELIMNEFSQKSKQEIADKQQGKVKAKKEPKDPEALYQASMYRFVDGRIGIPAAAFKKSMVDSIRQFQGVTMVSAKVSFFLIGEPGKSGQQLFEIIGTPRMREDVVRLADVGRTADLRYRAGFPEWKTTVLIKYNATQLSKELIINLLDAAGNLGVGEWRPSAPKSVSGDFGMFVIESVEEVSL